MEDYIGKICPFCGTEIKAEDEVFICLACAVPHHKRCWIENQGCATTGCKEQFDEANHTGSSVCAECGAPLDEGKVFCAKCGTPKSEIAKNVCSKCGAELQDDQAFCPMCGTPKGNAAKNVCAKCGEALQEGQAFCPKCGQKVDLAPANGTVPTVNPYQTGGYPASNSKKKTPLIIGIVAGVAVIAVVLTVVFITALGGSKNKNYFNNNYGDLADHSWCTIAADGSYMQLDTNPDDKDSDDFTYYDYSIYKEADKAIKRVNNELGFPDSLRAKMGETTWSQGKQTESNDKYIVTWTYHPDKGLEVMYEIKKK